MAIKMNVWNKPKAYEEIKKKICKNLVENWQPNDRLPPIKVLARSMGVGQSSTQQAIKELVREGILISKPRKGTFINTDPEIVKPKLKGLLSQETHKPFKNKKIQILTYNAVLERHTFFFLAVDAFSKFVAKAGHELMTTTLDNDTKYTESSIQDDADGVVMVNPSTFIKPKCLPSQVLTLITPSSEFALAMSERHDLVTVDDAQGSMLAGEFLSSMGHKDVCFLGVRDKNEPSQYDIISSKRLKSLCLGLETEIRPEWRLKGNSYSGFDAAPTVMDWLNLNPRPSVIFAASDDLAYGFIYGAAGHRLKAGQDFQIMGFDGQKNTPYDSNLLLTSIAIPVEEMGTLAAKMLLNRMDNPYMTPRRIYLGCKLLRGNTVLGDDLSTSEDKNAK
jgi:DNA-binding LacI/PurR family transcriptional regulator